MPFLPTLPRRTWLERSSLLIASLLLVIGVSTLVGTWAGVEAFVQPSPQAASIKANEALCFTLLGLVLLAIELGRPMASWAAVIPAAIAALSLAEHALRINLGLDELFGTDRWLVDTAHPGRMSAMSACSILLVSLALTWRSLRRGTPARLFTEAVISSLVASGGFSTLLGYAVSLPAVYRWGTHTATSPLAAAALLVLGVGLLILAWRETMNAGGGPPAWSPMPAIVGCLTFTLILWIGLRERETVYLGAKTQTEMDSLATSFKYEFDRQAAAIERLARMWADGALTAEAVWEVDAGSQWQDSSGRLGILSIAVLNPELRTIWVYPREENATAISLDHAMDPVRQAAIAAARINRGPVISGTTELGGRGHGVVIYAPIIRQGVASGYVAAEFLYRTFFSSVIAERKIEDGHLVEVKIGAEEAYRTVLQPKEQRHDALLIDKTYPMFDRRVRVTMTPRTEALQNDRRYLPELALGAGIGIALLLGLSVHLARGARAGQHAAELSNKKLHAENEERRRIEARLKVSDERLRLALDSTQIGIFEWNVAAGHVYYSSGLWAMLGYEHSRMSATVAAWQSLIHPDDLPTYRRRVDSQLNGVASFIEPEFRVKSHGGEWRWVYTRSKTVAASTSGRPTRIIGTVQDITARREAEQALRESQAETRKLSLVAAKTDNPVLIISPAGSIEWVNESFSRVMEYSLDEVVGRSPIDFVAAAETDARTLQEIDAAIAQGRAHSGDVVTHSKRGRKYHLRVELQPVRNDAGQLQNFIVIETDITARVDTELALRRAKTEADEASRAKSDFLASMSHEIRTPMNGVIGMTSLLMETDLSPEQRDFVNTIRTSGEALLTIINDILDFSKIESGKMDLEHLPFELATCLEESLDLFALQASAKHLELAYHIAPDVPEWIIGDITRLRQIVVNLVNNAVKFTSAGSIAIEVRRRPPTVPANLKRFPLEFVVRDTGIGIPAERLDRLFKAFSQVDSSTTRKYGGTGLGLAICQRLSILMGGGIRVESKVGEGSSFIFTITTEEAAAGAPLVAPPDLDQLKGCPVLCVEDHPVVQRRIAGLLEPYGATCHFAANAFAGAALAATLPTPPALVIIDGDETEGSSPLEALQSIKAPRLLMLPFGQTAPPPPADRQPFTSIFKPFKTTSFLHVVSALLNPATHTVIATDTTGPFTRRLAEEFPLDILLAEDNTVNQKVALRFLERLGYRADAVSNGQEAVTTLAARHYHLVLMDLQMPEMDGLEASRQIRKKVPASRQPKIVALTANAMQGDRERCLEAGMDDYISKPVKLHEIEAAIRRLFASREANTPQTIG
ncbi:response regulator [Opitutus terrae]|uniref:histidine kinase n=1 Tax=Opitutus terrae (strain DSM 11246 / JCM 15787 / PB90-1) TaxID=452637 RepID=B1ZMD0_OPITP|nr:response regulator [Opitutus terrae]ACB73383.1 multi-sensor hybrid histidine kinase [Opitutus terrae PB90-1]